MISNCGKDENGRYHGGQAGDQTGGEWAIIPWYDRPWSCVLRHPDATVRQLIADLARKAALNPNVGYDQDDRYTYWYALKDAGYDPEKIDVKCEADCSSGIAGNVKAAGYILGRQELQAVSIYMYTGNERAVLSSAGFEVLTGSKYLDSDDYLLPGDILLYDGHHTATNLDYGKEVQPVKPYYENIGWNADSDGWWYAYGHNKGQYHVNNILRFPDKDGVEKIWAFDTEGYLVNPSQCEMNPDGSIKYIHGDRIKP